MITNIIPICCFLFLSSFMIFKILINIFFTHSRRNMRGVGWVGGECWKTPIHHRMRQRTNNRKNTMLSSCRLICNNTHNPWLHVWCAYTWYTDSAKKRDQRGTILALSAEKRRTEKKRNIKWQPKTCASFRFDLDILRNTRDADL